MRKITILLFLIICSKGLLAQETLDLEKNKDCELFSEKKDFNRAERLEKIKELGGKSVTVYFIKGKDHKIKDHYTGKIDLTLVNKGDSPIENLTNVLVITVDKGNGQFTANFPMTNDDNYRIYLTECLNK